MLSEQELQAAGKLVAQAHLDEDIEFSTVLEVLDEEIIVVTESEAEQVYDIANAIITRLYKQI